MALVSTAWLAIFFWTLGPPGAILPTLASQFAGLFMLLNLFFSLGFFLTFSFHRSLCSFSFGQVGYYLACPKNPDIRHSSQGKYFREYFFYSLSLPSFHLSQDTHSNIHTHTHANMHTHLLFMTFPCPPFTTAPSTTTMGQGSNVPAYFAKAAAGIQTAAVLAEKSFSIFVLL